MGKTLDVGCGDGTLLHILANRYDLTMEPHGIEISSRASKKAAEKEDEIPLVYDKPRFLKGEINLCE